ncbi:hypothetical protein BDN70DRAFT_875738, partial [Pholiota conissans]
MSFDDNPVALELKTLRASVVRFQEEAHTSAVKLQRYSFDSAKLHERAVHLERENDQLKAELAVLRANPHPDDDTSESDARSQVQDMTLALRRLSQKLSSTEDALLSKTTELIHAQAEMVKAKAAAESAYELGAKVRGREEAALARERHLQDRIEQLEEDARIGDVALKEYAALVREMAAAKSSHTNGSATTAEEVDEGTRISATLLEGKLTRSRLLAQFEAETAKLETELQGARAEIEVTKSLLEAEKKVTAALVQELGNTKNVLEKLHLEDGTAAKMVSRYMQFSQTSTNALLSKLSTLKARHAGTLSTLSSQNDSLTARLRASEAHGERLLSTLDELGGEIMRETWGRRREVGLRIRMGGREERIAEGLRRWVRKCDEMIGRARSNEPTSHAESENVLEALLSVAQDARILLASLDEGVLDEEIALSLSSNRARAFIVNIGMDGLLDELRQESERRIVLEKRLAAVTDLPALNGFISGDEHVNAEAGPTNDKPQSDAPVPTVVVDGVSDMPPAVPEKSPILSPASQTTQLPPRHSPETADEATHNFTDTNDESIGAVSSSLNGDAFAQPIPFPSATISSVLVESTVALEVASETDAPALELSDPIMQTPSPLYSKVEVDSKDNNALGAEMVVTSEYPQNLESPATVPLAVDELPSILVPSPLLTISTLTQDASSESDTSQLVTSVLPTPAASTETTQDTSTSTPSQGSPPPTPPPTVEFPSTSTKPPSTSISSPPSPQHSPSPFASALPTVKTRTIIAPHPLLGELVRVTKRYDDLQRAFRDCHIALESLKTGVNDTMSASADSLQRYMIPKDILDAALRRLDDYTEDARVELEIRISDEALLSKGYEALLSVPGALSMVAPEGTAPDDNEVPVQSDVERQATEFVEGTDPAVCRARETFARKLEDVQHDIAALKRAIHDPEFFAPPGSSSSLAPSSSSSALTSPSVSSGDLSTSDRGSGQSSGGWTSWIRSASRPASPAPPSQGPAPTFGNIMTAPRLRHSPSSGNLHAAPPPQPPSVRARRPSFFGLGGGASEPPPNPLAALELRVPMPTFAAAGAHPSSPTSASMFGGPYGVLSPTSPLKPMTMAPGTRVRTVSSTMYMLGLGAAGAASNNGGGRMARSVSAAGGFVTPPSPSPLKTTMHGRPLASSSLGKGVPAPISLDTENEEEDTEEEDDTDV